MAKFKRTFFIDPVSGDDANEGTSTTFPLKSHINRTFSPGDEILFRRGTVIRETLIANNGNKEMPTVYGAYGEGEKPKFLGSVSIQSADDWIEEQPHIWRYQRLLPTEVCNLVFDDGASCGKMKWTLADLREEGDWFATNPYEAIRRLEHVSKRVSADQVYLFSLTNPGYKYRSIECVLWGKRKLVSAKKHVIIENLCFENSGVHGFFGLGVNNIKIVNCEFRFIGGAVWDREKRIRFGNAIELWDGATDITVERCVIDQIYDTGVTHQGGELRNVPKRIYFRNNLIMNCGLAAYESREPSQEVYFEHNTCVHSGGGFASEGQIPPRQSDPYLQPIGYHVAAWGIAPGTQPGKVYIRHNLFYESYGASLLLQVDAQDEKQFEIEHNSYWQTLGHPLYWSGMPHASSALENNFILGKKFIARSVYLISQFEQYKHETGNDQLGQVAQPLFFEDSSQSYQQTVSSPCLAAGIQWKH